MMINGIQGKRLIEPLPSLRELGQIFYWAYMGFGSFLLKGNMKIFHHQFQVMKDWVSLLSFALQITSF